MAKKKVTVPAVNKEKDIQQKMIMYQLLQKHLEELKQQAMIIERKNLELEITKQSVKDIDALKKDNEILISLGSGFYGFGEFNDLKKILVDIGSGVFIKKTVGSASDILKGKGKEIEDLNKKLQHELNDVVTKMNEIAAEVETAQRGK